MADVDSKLTVVTGAAGALGRAVVEEFVGRGATVAALDLEGERLSGLPAELGAERVLAVPVDLTDLADVTRAWERVDGLGAPAALVCVAGAFAGGDLDGTDQATLDSMLSVNLASMLWAARAAAPRMRRAGGGAIVTVGSRTGVAGSGPVADAAAKAAVIRATEVLADELRPDRIRV
ncbi:MAG TPA: SDR family NAD(P)-dependent oxidoreductase, partial [Actinoplanes sp.]|nr:SDR family NAD(P)-dependent oxidoreductase [Actinoplanes sp.]